MSVGHLVHVLLIVYNATWSRNHLVPCVVELVGSWVPIHAYRGLPNPMCLFNPSGLSLCLPPDQRRKDRIKEANTQVWLSCHVKRLNEAYARILKSHGIATANRPHCTLRNILVHPKRKVKDEEKSDLTYQIPCKNCPSSYLWGNRQEARPGDEGAPKRSGFLHSGHTKPSLPS